MSNLYYRGDTILLYVVFKDLLGNPATLVTSPIVSVVHESNSQIVYDLNNIPLTQISNSEYFYNLQIDSEADLGFREVIYSGIVAGSAAQVIESFHIIPNSDVGENVVKIHGVVNQLKTGLPLIGVSIKVSNTNINEVYSETFTKFDGYWEAYLYPAEYTIDFYKFGFLIQQFTVQIGNERTELKFNNVALEYEKDINKGNGTYPITDKFITRFGVPLNGLNVKAFSIFDMINEIASDSTNEEGEYQLYLDPGIYLIKVNGNSLSEDYNYVFRLKISEDGKNQLEDLSGNIATASDQQFVGNGSGSVHVSDTITDKNGTPIIDVQITVFVPNDLNTVVAEDYTDVTGTWNVYLEPGQYVFEFFHPEFNLVTENRTV